jgi:hypothetical protein
MSLNVVNSSSDRYSYDRDVTNLFPFLARRAAIRLADVRQRPPIAAEFMRAHNVTEQDVVEATAMLGAFASATVTTTAPTVQEALQVCGWTRLPRPVRVMLSALLGDELMTAYHSFVRMAMPKGWEPKALGALRNTEDMLKFALGKTVESARSSAIAAAATPAEQRSDQFLADQHARAGGS